MSRCDKVPVGWYGATSHPTWPGRVEGVQVLQVEHGSPAWSADLGMDDIIFEVRRMDVAAGTDIMNFVK